MSPRRIRRNEEDELLAIAADIARIRENLEKALTKRDHLIADLLDDRARAADVADILQLTPAAVYDAAKRARHRH